MKFNVWLVVMLALMPVLALFAGMSVSAGFDSPGDWWVLVAIGAGIALVGYRASRATH